MKQRERIAWLLSVVLLAVLALSVPGSMAGRDDDYRFVRTLIDIQRIVSGNFVGEIDDTKLRNAAINGMLEALDDPFTIYVPPELHEQFENMLEGNFKGVGIELNQRPDGTIEIITPIEGSPAFEAGVLAGDVLLKVNDEDVAGQRLREVIPRIQGPTGSQVTLTLRRTDGEVVDLTMKRAEFVVPTLKGYRRSNGASWDYWVQDSPKIAYVRLTQFTPDSAAKLRAVVEDLLKQGMEGLIFDLRFNPGGRLDEAVKIVDMFIKEGVIVKTRGRNRPEATANATEPGTLPDFNMVVLINEQSASASEVVAGSLLDNRRAVVIGSRSFGKGSVQEPIVLDGGGDLKITVAYYYLPSGRLVHRKKDATDWGVEPQIHVATDDDQKRAILRGQAEADAIRGAATRPSSTQPSTQPIIDPQLQRAIETLVAIDVVRSDRTPASRQVVEPIRADVIDVPSTAPATQPVEVAPPATQPASE